MAVEGARGMKYRSRPWLRRTGVALRVEDRMVDTKMNLERIVEPVRERVGQLAELVIELGGETVQSLTLYGAIAAGVFDATRHTVRSVLVLKKIDLDLLRRLSEHGVKLGKARIAAPLVMTREYITASLDTFALELIEIGQMHVTVFGEDPFTDLSFKDEHVRLQCERELKSVLIGLRQGLLAATGRDKVLESIELDVAESLVRTMRGMLWLKGQKDAKSASEVVGDVEKNIERKLPGLRAALDVSGAHGWDQFQSLYHDVEALAKVADA